MRLPVTVAHGRFAEEGRGPALLTAVVDRWGVEPVAGGGKRVWFECTGKGDAGAAGQPAPA